MKNSYQKLNAKYNNLVERHNLMCKLLNDFDFNKNTKNDIICFIQWLLYHTEVEMKKEH